MPFSSGLVSMVRYLITLTLARTTAQPSTTLHLPTTLESKTPMSTFRQGTWSICPLDADSPMHDAKGHRLELKGMSVGCGLVRVRPLGGAPVRVSANFV